MSHLGEAQVQLKLRKVSIRTSRDSSSSGHSFSYKSETRGTYLRSLKSLYDRQISKVTKSKVIIPTMPQKNIQVSNLRGRSISNVEVSNSKTRIKMSSRQMSSTDYKLTEDTLPNHIYTMSVALGLNEKVDACATHDANIDITEATLSETDLGGDETRKHTFKGNITLLQLPHYDSMKAPLVKHLSVSSSTQVLQSEVEQQSLLEDIWAWPWIDFTQSPLHLYKDVLKRSTTDLVTLAPKLPFPDPVHAVKRYLETVEPHATFQQFQNTKAVAERFLKNEIGPLHANIISCNQYNSSWIQKYLHNHDFCYSKQGSPMINLGIIAPFCHDIWPEKYDSMLERAIILVRLATEFWDLIRTETLKPVQDDNGHKIDMQQFLDLFSSTTIPGTPKTLKCRLMKTQNQGKTARHIIVIYRGTVFSMVVADEKYQPLPLMEIGRRLNALIKFVESGEMNERDGLSVLTASVDIGSWSEERRRISQFQKNEDYFNEIDYALFVLSLDHMSVNSLDQVVNEALFADGCNRWYDKGLNFYIHNNGYVTLNINSKLLDGQTVAFLLHYIHLRILDESQSWEDEIIPGTSLTPKTNSLLRMCLSQLVILDNDDSSTQEIEASGRNPKRDLLKDTSIKMLNFSTDNESHGNVEECADIFRIIASGVLTAVCKIDDFDKDSSLTPSVNSDAFAHMALHLTFFRMHYRPASIGCKVSIRAFSNIRYDIMRSTTNEMAEWCKIYLDTGAEKEKKSELFWKAHDKHVELLKECLSGKGYVNYLNALRNLAQPAGIPPENNVFEDEGYFLSGGGERYDILAETLGVGCTSCPVFLPYKPNGYGVGYCIAKCFLFFTVTSWDEEAGVCAPLFASALNQTCRELVAHTATIVRN